MKIFFKRNSIAIICDIAYNIRKYIDSIRIIFKDYDKDLLKQAAIEEIYKVVDKLYEGKYKLIQVGPSTAYDYLLRVGIKTSKSTKNETISIIINIAKEIGLSETEVYNILWQFCIKSGANICTPIPNCN